MWCVSVHFTLWTTYTTLHEPSSQTLKVSNYLFKNQTKQTWRWFVNGSYSKGEKYHEISSILYLFYFCFYFIFIEFPSTNILYSRLLRDQQWHIIQIFSLLCRRFENTEKRIALQIGTLLTEPNYARCPCVPSVAYNKKDPFNLPSAATSKCKQSHTTIHPYFIWSFFLYLSEFTRWLDTEF